MFILRTLIIILSALALNIFAEVTFEQAIDLALNNSPEIKSAAAEKSAQLSKQVSSWLDLGPRLSTSYKHIFYDDKIKVPMGTGEVLFRDDQSKLLSLTLSQPITPLVALVQRARIEGKKKQIKDSELKLSHAHVAFKVAELYLGAQQSTRMWEIAKSSIISSEAQRKDGQALLKAERIHKGDLLKLELALSQAHLAEAKARAAKEMAYFSLAQAIYYDDYKTLVLSALNTENMTFENSSSLDNILREALQKREEIKQAKLGEEVASLAQFTAFAKFFPDINFFAQLDRNFGAASFASQKETKFLGFNLKWDFWNNGATIFEAREAAFMRTKALYQGAIVKRNISLDAMQARSALEAAQENIAFAHKAVEQAQEAYRIESLQFKAGKSSATQLVLAETARTQAETNLVSVLSDLKIQKFKLQKARGALKPEL